MLRQTSRAQPDSRRAKSGSRTVSRRRIERSPDESDIDRLGSLHTLFEAFQLRQMCICSRVRVERRVLEGRAEVVKRLLQGLVGRLLSRLKEERSVKMVLLEVQDGFMLVLFSRSHASHG